MRDYTLRQDRTNHTWMNEFSFHKHLHMHLESLDQADQEEGGANALGICLVRILDLVAQLLS